MPQIGIARVDLFLRGRDGNSSLGRVRDRVLATPDIPLAPWRNDGEIGCERSIGQLEAHLIVALTGTAVGERVRAHAARNLDLPPRNERPRHRSAEQILAIV